MRHNDDAFATMLLTLPLSANKEELARPLSNVEFAQLIERVNKSPVNRLGELMNMDISGMMRALDASEAEAYRLCVLLNRTIPLSYAMERYYEHAVDIVTLFDASYPDKAANRLGDEAPPAIYSCGDLKLLQKPLIGILGIAGVKMPDEIKNNVVLLAENVHAEGFGIVTSSELGACRLAEMRAMELGAKLVCVLAGDLMRRKDEEFYAEAIARKQMLLLSLVHPDAPHTAVHALARNRLVYALSLAAFIATTDAKRGESEALRRHYLDWLYAFDGLPGNRVVIGRGATPVYDVSAEAIQKYARNWNMACAEQLSFL